MSSPPVMPDSSSAEPLVEAFRSYLSREKLKATRQRDLIVQVFASVSGHVNAQELWAEVTARDPSIGYATVYRTLKLLAAAGLAIVHRFGDGQTRYEVQRAGHHDHLICLECGLILEFHSRRLERLQEEVARRHHFHVVRHRHELFGVCEAFLSGRTCPYRRDAAHQSGRLHTSSSGVDRGFIEEIPPVDQLPAAFRSYLLRRKLKSTRQRELIVEVFATIDGHVTVDELLTAVRQRDVRVSYATVYRTLKILVEAGLAIEREFSEERHCYERRSREHHDHMICERTGTIIEFHDDEIEALQEKIARERGFRLFRHRHELYGYLEEDAEGGRRRSGRTRSPDRSRGGDAR